MKELAVFHNSITKANALLDASYKLNAQAQKLVLACLSKLDPRGEVPKEVTLTTAEFSQLLGVDANVRRDLYRAADALFKSSITLKDAHEEVEVYWIQKKAKKLKGEGAVTLTWSDDVLKYISQLKSRFTTYKLRNIANLSSGHSIRLYELLMRFNDTGERVIYLDDFKAALGLTGRYPMFKDLNKWVIKPSIDELNQRSDIVIKFDRIKKGRSIVALSFEFKRSDQMKFDGF